MLLTSTLNPMEVQVQNFERNHNLAIVDFTNDRFEELHGNQVPAIIQSYTKYLRLNLVFM